jgi:hypothetical protein
MNEKLLVFTDFMQSQEVSKTKDTYSSPIAENIVINTQGVILSSTDPWGSEE